MMIIHLMSVLAMDLKLDNSLGLLECPLTSAILN